MTYFNQLTNPKKELVMRIVCRPKGYILACTNYDCFVYKDSKLGTLVKQLLIMFGQDNRYHKELYITPNKQMKQGFYIEAGNPNKWFCDQQFNWSTQIDETEEFINQVLEQFKLPTASLPTNARDDQEEAKNLLGDEPNPDIPSKGARRSRKAP